MNINEKSNVVPANIKSWVDDMLNKTNSPQERHNRWLMLEFTHRYLGEALRKYDQDLNKRNR